MLEGLGVEIEWGLEGEKNMKEYFSLFLPSRSASLCLFLLSFSLSCSQSKSKQKQLSSLTSSDGSGLVRSGLLLLRGGLGGHGPKGAHSQHQRGRGRRGGQRKGQDVVLPGQLVGQSRDGRAQQRARRRQRLSQPESPLGAVPGGGGQIADQGLARSLADPLRHAVKDFPGSDPVERRERAEAGVDPPGRGEHRLVERREQRAEDDHARRREHVRQSPGQRLGGVAEELGDGLEVADLGVGEAEDVLEVDGEVAGW